MKIITNTKLIEKNKKIGNYTMIASLVILGVGLVISFIQVELVNYAFLSLIIGFFLSQISIYYANRFGKSPRPDELITQSLKGLDDKYYLYHYTTPVPHLLVGPGGVFVLAPYSQTGKIYFDTKKNRWAQKGGNFYLKIFAQDSIGRPDLDVKTQIEDLQKFLIKNSANEADLPEIKAILLFTSKKVEVEQTDSEPPAIMIDKLKEIVRRTSKESPMKQATLQNILNALPNE
jgi:hypothetical protein